MSVHRAAHDSKHSDGVVSRINAKAHGLTFPVLLQQQWEISRRYAMFATPISYLIDEAGIITRDVAVGVEPILGLLGEASTNALRSGYNSLAVHSH